ncbi:MAG: hypothetical protein IPG38_01570 [Chitinophagaceae bacterium]|nr:hypothetical protein [Chitinophagaceae bacterium]
MMNLLKHIAAIAVLLIFSLSTQAQKKNWAMTSILKVILKGSLKTSPVLQNGSMTAILF